MARTKRFVSRVNLVPRVDSRINGTNTGQCKRSNEVRSTIRSSGGSVRKKVDGRWLKTLEEVQRLKEKKGSYPKSRSSLMDERRLYRWLKNNLPWADCWSESRWLYLTDTFGMGWESECFPFLGREGNSKGLDRTWLQHCDEARQWKEEKGSYPKDAKGLLMDERRLYKWLQQNLPGKPSWSETRWSYLTDAFGMGWERDCFPFSMPEGKSKGLDRTWLQHCDEARQWRKEKGSYPKSRGSSGDERRLYRWLKNNLPGKPSWSETRWSYLTDAFGEHWDTQCFPSRNA